MALEEYSGVNAIDNPTTVADERWKEITLSKCPSALVALECEAKAVVLGDDPLVAAIAPYVPVVKATPGAKPKPVAKGVVVAGIPGPVVAGELFEPMSFAFPCGPYTVSIVDFLKWLLAYYI